MKALLSKLLTCSLSKGENVQVARGWGFSFSVVSCEPWRAILSSHLASGEDFWVLKAQVLRETVNRMMKPLNRVDADLLSGS